MSKAHTHVFECAPLTFFIKNISALSAAALRPASFRPVNLNEAKGAIMSGKKYFYIDPENRPNRTTRERVVSERGRKELPPGTKGGENLKPDRHYEHKQHAFDSYCKKVLKCEACNGYREISRRQKRVTSLEDLSEAEWAQLAVYDRYSWEYTTFPVGGAVILIEDDRLAEALLGLSQENREIFMMHWFLRMTDEQIAKHMDMARRTVNTRRHKAYQLLKELMGGEADD